ncbi:MAG TPA: glycosyltransferase family 2 protein [Bryobacteraceae bacterium]|nr:glycosyltransferase family 2 protein [Bryobacteraceae bacterium]
MSRRSIQKRPRVSVLIPAFNAGRYIEATLASALGQTEPDLEIVVVNNGSSDDTEDRLRACTDPRLCVINQATPGLAAALNAAILAARADYIAFLDADDIWLPGKLALHLVAHQERPEIDATFSWVRIIDSQGRPVRMPSPRWRGSVNFFHLLTDFSIRTMSAIVMKRQAALRAGLLDQALSRCVDIDFLLRVTLLRPDNIVAVPQVLNLYRRHDAQRTSDWSMIRGGWSELLEKMRALAPDQTAKVERMASSNMYRYFAFLAYVSGDFHEATRLAARSFALSPGRFFLDRRNWEMSAAVIASRIMPTHALTVLEHWAGFDRPGSKRRAEWSTPRHDKTPELPAKLDEAAFASRLPVLKVERRARTRSASGF